MACVSYGVRDPKSTLAGAVIFNNFTKIEILPFFESKMVEKKLRLRGWDPPGEIRAEILPLGAVPRSQMVPRRPIW